MRTCSERKVHLLVEREIDPRHAPYLRHHVAECPRCSAKYEQFAHMKSFIEDGVAKRLTAPDMTDAVMRRLSEPVGWRMKESHAFFKKALVVAAASVAALFLGLYLFFHFYFQRTFSHQLGETVIRCSVGIEVRRPTKDWQNLSAGQKLDENTEIRTPPNRRSFLSFDGIRLLTDGETALQIDGRRALSIHKGSMFIESAPKDAPLVVNVGSASVTTRAGAFRITRNRHANLIGVASGSAELSMVGTTQDLLEGQIARFEDGLLDSITLGRVGDPFKSLKESVIERIRRRFAEVMSRYLPDYHLGIPGMHSKAPVPGRAAFSSIQFASFMPGTFVAQHSSQELASYYENFFIPSNRSITIGRQRVVRFERDTGPTFPRWAHDGSMIAFMETTPGALVGRARVVRVDDLENPWDISQQYEMAVRPMLPPAWAPDNRHVLFQVQTGQAWDEHGPTGNFKIVIVPIDPAEGPPRDFNSPFFDIPVPLPLPVGKTISPSIEKLPWGDAMVCANWGNMAYISVEENGQSVPTAPGLFLTNFDPRRAFVMGGGFSPSGNKMDMTVVEDLNFNNMNVYILYDAEDILDGFAQPPRSLDDPRIKHVAPTRNVQFTGGWSYDESLTFVHEDVNRAFDARWPTNIINCDFDILYANALPGEPGQPTQLHLPGNQMFLTPSPEGNRLAYCNYEGNQSELRVVSFDIGVDIQRDLGGVLIDNSGSSLIVPPGALQRNFSVRINTPFSIREEAELTPGEHTFFAMRLIDAEGLQQPTFLEPMTLTIRYTEQEVAGMDEGMLEVYYYDESDPNHPAWVPLGGTVDPDHNEITVEIQHFSKFAVGPKR
ncbi:MAG: hypothetical protein Kow0099_22840 [Candidatus Abyssubacteria bacterium]